MVEALQDYLYKMNTNFISNFLSGEGINLDRFYSHINFINVSGSIVKNSVYPNETQFGSNVSGNFIFDEYHPSVFTSCYKYSDLSGSGLFDANNSLKLNQRLNSGQKTILLHFENEVSNNYANTNLIGKNKVLFDFCSPESSTDQFSYSVSLTDKNDMLIEFSGQKSGIVEYNKSFVKDSLPDKNIICLSLKNNRINLIQPDVNTNTFIYNELKINQNYDDVTKEMYIGNKVNFIKNTHTGFSGVLKDVIVINQILNENQLLRLTKIVGQTGELYSGINLTPDPYKIYYSGKVNPTGIIGTGIIRYDRVVQETINTNCGDNSSCNIYVLSGVTGLLTGYKIEYSAEEQITEDFTNQKIYPMYDPNLFNNYSDYNIKDLLTNTRDIYEIQTYEDDVLSDIYTGSGLNYLPDDLNYIFYNGRVVKDFITGLNSLKISGAKQMIFVSGAKKESRVNGSYIESGIYNYNRYINGIPVPVTKKTLYASINESNYFIRWTNNSGWTIIGNNMPIYGSSENVSNPDEISLSSWFSYSGYINMPNIRKYQYINIIKKLNSKSLYFVDYTVNKYISNTGIDLSYFNKYNVFLDGLKLIEHKDYGKIGNSIYFDFDINNKKLLILEDSYTEKITGNNISDNLKIYPKKHLLWVNGLLKIDGIDYNNKKYNLNGGYFNNIERNNIQILMI
jgi:hypothetical protein